MKKTKSINLPIITLLFSVLLSACDPLRVLYFKNDTSVDVSLKVKFKEQLVPCLRDSNANNKFEKITIKSHTKVRFSCGMGTWSKENVADVRNSIQSVTLKNDRSSKIYSKDSIDSALIIKKSGGFGNIIRIQIKE